VYCCGAKRSQQIRPWLNKPGEGEERSPMALVFGRQEAESGSREAEGRPVAQAGPGAAAGAFARPWWPETTEAVFTPVTIPPEGGFE